VYYINSWDFTLTSRALPFLLDTCHVPEVLVKFSLTTDACLASNRSDSLRAGFQCVNDSWVD
jgi:hypothetical protein